jgi:uncharacterized protein YjbI with pentapeptide repeats
VNLCLFRASKSVVLSTLLVSGPFLGAASLSDPAHLAQLKTTRSCSNCDLSGADLSGFVLINSDLSGANLSTAKLYKADLSGANLKNAILIGADLSGAKLTGAIDANLTGAKTDAKTICVDGTAGPCK